MFALHGLGMTPGIDLDRLVEASLVIANSLDHLLPGRYFQAARVQACVTP